MSADSFHHQVELSFKKKGKVYDFDDFVDAVQKAQKSKTEVKILSNLDFYKWKDLRTQPRGFPKDKKDAILKSLGGIMPENRRNFWINLPETKE